MAGACASKLDFDAVSSGPRDEDAAIQLVDASSADARSVEFDAGNAAARQPGDNPAFGGELTGRDASASNLIDPRSQTDASAPPSADMGIPMPNDVTNDPTSFSCASVSPVPSFCEDFEPGSSEQLWTQFYVYPQKDPPIGKLEFDGTSARSGSYALLAEVNAGTPPCDDDGCVALVAGFGLPDLTVPSQVSVEFDLLVEQIDPTPDHWIVLMQLYFGDEGDRSWQTLQINSFGSSMNIGLAEYEDAKPTMANATPDPGEAVHDFHPAVQLNTWVHVAYILDAPNPSGTGNSARLLIDGGLWFDGPLSFAMRERTPFLEIGVPWVGLSSFMDKDTIGGWRMHYDNIVVRVGAR